MYVKVKVIADGKKELVKKIDDTTFEMVVKQKPERNMANVRIREILSSEYGVIMGKVRIVTGHHSQSKIFDIAL